jgi:diacylglycerol kinase family enzyme
LRFRNQRATCTFVEVPTRITRCAAAREGGAVAVEAEICVIVNSKSGKQDGAERIEAIRDAFARAGAQVDIHALQPGDDATVAAEAAVDRGYATIVAAGGDGTISAVAGALAGADRRMGVLAFGTFNYFARSLGLPEDLDEAAEVIVAGHTRTLDLGEVNGHVFVNNASLGAYPAILDHREQFYRRWGRSRIAAYWSMMLTLVRFRRPLRVTMTVDGAERQLRTPLIFVSRNAGQLESVGLEGGDCVRSGRFAVFVAPDVGRFGLVLYALRLGLGLAEPREDFELLCGREVDVVTARHSRLVARDGERERMQSPFRFRLRPGALDVLVPAEA